MTEIASRSACSAVPPPRNGTAEHPVQLRGTPSGTPAERPSLKALARKVLQAEHPAERERNSTPETPPEQRSTGTPSRNAQRNTPEGAELHRQRTRLLTLARELGIPRLVIAELPDAEIEGCQHLTDPGLRRYAQICLENWLTARGVIVLHPTDPTKDLERYRITNPTGTPR